MRFRAAYGYINALVPVPLQAAALWVLNSTTPYIVGAQGRGCQLTCINYSAQFFNPPTSVEELV